MTFTEEQMSLSTADDELNYFSCPVQVVDSRPAGSAMPDGMYRVVDGVLYFVLPTVPEPEAQGFIQQQGQTVR